MRRFRFNRLLTGTVLGIGLAAGPVFAQQEAGPAVEQQAETPWQDVITSQIQAFRDGDASAAFSYAGAGFQVAFPNADLFFAAIVSSGYSPIMESRSHSFGAFQRVNEAAVIQEVRFVGKDQDLYTALYQLAEEEEGWRVQAVQLLRQPGIGV